MREKVFRFKMFSVKNDLSAMKVGTDGVMIGAWATIDDATNNILDIGAGSGLISLMVAQRSKFAQITGVEIDEAAVFEAKDNVMKSPWENRITMHHASLSEFAASCNIKFDLIVSNPPFFNNGIIAPDKTRAMARHTDTLDLADFIAISSKLITENGRISFIYPMSEINRIIAEAKRNHLYAVRETTVYPTESLPAKRILIELSKQQEPLKEDSLVIEISRNSYTEEYINLTKDFYLNM